jgi:hypothetical protein
MTKEKPPPYLTDVLEAGDGAADVFDAFDQFAVAWWAA